MKYYIIKDLQKNGVFSLQLFGIFVQKTTDYAFLKEHSQLCNMVFVGLVLVRILWEFL